MNTTLAVLGLGGGDLVLVMVVILVLFGAKKIPEFAKGLGKGISEFKKASSEVTNEINSAMEQQPAAPKPTPPAPAAPVAQTTTTTPSAGPTVTKI